MLQKRNAAVQRLFERVISTGLSIVVAAASWSANLSYEKGFFEEGGKTQKIWLGGKLDGDDRR